LRIPHNNQKNGNQMVGFGDHLGNCNGGYC